MDGNRKGSTCRCVGCVCGLIYILLGEKWKSAQLDISLTRFLKNNFKLLCLLGKVWRCFLGDPPLERSTPSEMAGFFRVWCRENTRIRIEFLLFLNIPPQGSCGKHVHLFVIRHKKGRPHRCGRPYHLFCLRDYLSSQPSPAMCLRSS